MTLQDLLKQAHEIQEQLNALKKLQETLKRNKDVFSLNFTPSKKISREDLYSIYEIINKDVNKDVDKD